VTSHPDLNNGRDATFYGELRGGGQAVFLFREGRLHVVADTHGAFASIGPLGPTINHAGNVGFRADPADGVSGIFAGDADALWTVADSTGPWGRFHGLPVITGDDTVVFRADRKNGVQGIYSGSAESIRTVAETGERFASLGLFPSANERGTVAFAATLRDGRAGIFTDDDGRIMRIAETGDAFEAFRGALITDAGAVVMIATPRGGVSASSTARTRKRAGSSLSEIRSSTPRSRTSQRTRCRSMHPARWRSGQASPTGGRRSSGPIRPVDV
jgi:hypothetical protein